MKSSLQSLLIFSVYLSQKNVILSFLDHAKHTLPRTIERLPRRSKNSPLDPILGQFNQSHYVTPNFSNIHFDTDPHVRIKSPKRYLPLMLQAKNMHASLPTYVLQAHILWKSQTSRFIHRVSITKSFPLFNIHYITVISSFLLPNNIPSALSSNNIPSSSHSDSDRIIQSRKTTNKIVWHLRFSR
jgi:hypothetical protein